MKPLLVIEVQYPADISRSSAKTVFMNTLNLLREKLLENYEVIVMPSGSPCGIEIKTEGMVKVNIDQNTKFDELFKYLDDIARLKSMANELIQIAKDHPDVKVEKVIQDNSTPNSNGRTYYESRVGCGSVPSIDSPINFAARGMVGPDGNIKIISMDIVKERLRNDTQKHEDPVDGCPE